MKKQLAVFLILGISYVLSGAEYVHNGKFLELNYLADRHRHVFQPNWVMTPHSYSAYKLIKDVEADSANSYLNVNCRKKPLVTYEKLNLDTTLIAVPAGKTRISFRARGEGRVGAYVFEYVKTDRRPQYLRRNTTFKHVKISKDWKTYSFDYTPGAGELGMVMIRFNFRPASGEALNIDFGYVSAEGPEDKRSGVPARIVIPKMAKAPVIDGNVDDNEWKSAIRLSGFKDILSRNPAPGKSVVRVGYDRDFIYVSYKADSGDKPVATITQRDSAVYRDDSIETLFFSDDGSKFSQIIINAFNAIYDNNIPGGSGNAWNIDVKSAVKSSSTGWSMEMAIPRKSLDVKINDDEPFRMNFFQNDQIVTADMKRLINSVWSVNSIDRNQRATTTMYDNYPVAVLSDKLISASVATNDNGTLQLYVNNPGKEAAIYCEYGTSKRKIGVNVYKVPTGSSTFPVPFVPNDELAVVAVRDASGRELYRNAEIYKYRLETFLSLKKFFPNNFIELSSAITSVSDYRLCWSIDGVIKGEFKVNGKSGRNFRIPVDKLEYKKPYKLNVEILDNSGASLGKRTFDVLRPAREPWFDSKLGLTDEPLPPFIPVKYGKSFFEFLMQRYEYGDRALPIKVKSENIDILAAAVTLRLNGRDLADGVKRTITSVKPNRVEWKGENARTRWSGWVEEDGFAWYEVTLKKDADFTARSLYLDIPVKKEFVKFLSPYPFYRSGGDMDGRYCYDYKPWISMDFKQIVTVRNEYRGIELVAEDARDFSRKSNDGYHRLIPQKDRVVVRMTIIDKPVKLDRERTYRFGILTFPTKPFKLHKDVFATTSYIDPRSAAWSGGKDKVQISFPLKKLWRGGTIELGAYWDFDVQNVYPDYHVWPELRQSLISVGQWHLMWSAAEGGFMLRAGKKLLFSKKPWPVKRGYNVISVIQKKGELTVFVNGQKAEVFKSPEIGKVPVRNFQLGKSEMKRHADYHYDYFKVVNRELKPEEMGKCTRVKGTSTFQIFTEDSVKNYRVTGTPRFVKTDKGVRVSASAEHFCRLDAQEAVGVKDSLGYLNRIFTFYGPRPWGYRLLPYTNEEGYKAYGILIDNMTRRGIKLYYGWSFGYRVNSYEDEFYRDYYSIQPARLYGADENGFYIMCTGCVDYQNSLLYHFDNLMKRYDNQHIYTDNQFVSGRECRNIAHGCGYYDEKGELQMAGNMLQGRKFAKRIYALTKLRKIPRYHFMHSSGCNHALYMSWADRYLCGEQFLEVTNNKSWDIDLAQYVAQNVSNCFGVPAISITTFVPFGFRGMSAVASLHNCGASGANHHRYPDDLFDAAPVFKAHREFETHKAGFVPYYEKQSAVTTDQSKRQYCSYYVKDGELLLVVANLTWKPADVTVRLDLKKLGVKGIASDIWSGKAVPIGKDGKLTVKIPLYEAKYIRVK